MKAANQRPARHSFSKTLVVICVLAIVWFSFAAATHFHPISASGAEGHCEFCLVVHGNAAAVPVVSAPIPVLNQVLTQVLPAEEYNPKSLLPGSDLYIRPPPLV